jgi:outer membrane lipoprotein carrier protein
MGHLKKIIMEFLWKFVHSRFRISNILFPGLFFAIFFMSNPAWTMEDAEARVILNKMISSFQRVSTIQASFSLLDESGTGMRGLLRYSHPGKIRVDLTEPAGKKIVANGKYLWVYDEARGVVGRQNLYEKSFSSGLWFLHGYENVTGVKQSEGYILRLRSNTKGWKSVTIRMKSDFIPVSITMDDGRGNTQTFSLSNVKTGISFMGQIFDFRVPDSSQLVENPLNLK